MAEEKYKWWGDDRETAELIWCAAHLHCIIAPPSFKDDLQPPKDLPSPDRGSSTEKPLEDSGTTPPVTEVTEPRTPIAVKKPDHPPAPVEERESSSSDRASPIRVPDPFPLPKPAAISKGLLPLAKRVPGILANELDIDTTVERTAEANGLLSLAFHPPLERWFEVHLLIDHSPSMAFWGDLAEGVATLFRWQGFFRDVRVWQFETRNSEPRLFSGAESIEREIRSLIAPGRNRLFIVLTDTLGKAWYSGDAFKDLAVLGEKHPVSIAHIFPQTLWRRTALEQAIQRPLVAPEPGCANSMLKVGARLHTTARLYRFPIFNLSPNHFTTWANFLAGSGGNSIQGVLIRQQAPADTQINNSNQMQDKPEPGEQKLDLLREFLTNASPQARELAKVLAAVPLFPPVMRLAQKRFLPDTEHWHLAEVFFSGLVQRSPFSPEKVTVLETWYEYKPEIRELLLENSSVQRTAEIWREIGDLIQYNYGSLRDFQALIYNPNGSIQDMAARRDLYFAEVKAAILMTWGGEYAALAGQLSLEVALGKQPKDQSVVQIKGFPPIETLQFDVATITVEDNTETPPRINLQTFEFEVALIHHPLSIHRHPQQAQYFIEDLGNGVQLEMIAIPEGNFLMGSPEDELQRSDSESPQHPVSIKPFYMGKYPITQAQWRAIALLPQVNRELKPDPSRFKGEDLPVEKVSWYDAVEFCDRLTRFVNERRLSECASKSYQLPSEAQWEYACRAGTTTPFHFGETIISDLANYDASSTYGVGVKGIYRGKTKPVGSFGVANAFGLYDMHGNVWEWCADHWHSNYKKAPNDETIWLFSNETFRLLRGGSWRNNPGDCRCASRYNDLAVNDGNNVGFRVVCGEL